MAESEVYRTKTPKTPKKTPKKPHKNRIKVVLFWCEGVHHSKRCAIDSPAHARSNGERCTSQFGLSAELWGFKVGCFFEKCGILDILETQKWGGVRRQVTKTSVNRCLDASSSSLLRLVAGLASRQGGSVSGTGTEEKANHSENWCF